MRKDQSRERATKKELLKMANKKKTSVVLPGGIAGLVHQVQRGGGEPARSENEPQTDVASEPSREDAPETTYDAKPVQASAEPAEAVKAEAEKAEQLPESGEAPKEKRRRGRPATPKQAETPTEKAEREYHIVKDGGADSWDLFLSLGRIYKTRDERLATIYIDPDLKRILDRLKTASGVKLPTAAILSSIVARFIFDHEKKINDVIFGERLI